jgi:hypothetical protein
MARKSQKPDKQNDFRSRWEELGKATSAKRNEPPTLEEATKEANTTKVKKLTGVAHLDVLHTGYTSDEDLSDDGTLGQGVKRKVKSLV